MIEGICAGGGGREELLTFDANIELEITISKILQIDGTYLIFVHQLYTPLSIV